MRIQVGQLIDRDKMYVNVRDSETFNSNSDPPRSHSLFQWTGQLPCYLKYLCIGGTIHIKNIIDMCFWNNQSMAGIDRINIQKCTILQILPNSVRGSLIVYN